MFIYTQNMYPRRGWERVFMQLYNITIVAQISAIVIAFSDFADRVDSTFTDFWTSSTVTLSPPLVSVLANCSYTGTFKAGSFSSLSSMSLDAAPFPFIFFTLFTFGTFIIYAILILIIIFAALMHTWNVRHFRIRGLRIQLHTILLCHILGLSGCLIILLQSTIDVRKFLNEYVNGCAARYSAVNGNMLLEAEFATNVVFGTNLNWCLGCIVFNMAVFSLAMTFVIHNSLHKSLGKFESSFYPWQQGFMCRPNKLELVYYTRQRNELLKELEDDPTIDARTMGAFPFPNTYALQQQHAQLRYQQQQQVHMNQMHHDPLQQQRQHVSTASAISRQQQRRLLEQHAAAVQYAPEEEEQAMQEFAVDGEEFNPDEDPRDVKGSTHRRRHRSKRLAEDLRPPAADSGEQLQEDGGEEGERRHRRRHRRRRDKLDEGAPLEGNE
jgi:hypothetical protein